MRISKFKKESVKLAFLKLQVRRCEEIDCGSGGNVERLEFC